MLYFPKKWNSLVEMLVFNTFLYFKLAFDMYQKPYGAELRTLLNLNSGNCQQIG